MIGVRLLVPLLVGLLAGAGAYAGAPSFATRVVLPDHAIQIVSALVACWCAITGWYLASLALGAPR